MILLSLSLTNISGLEATKPKVSKLRFTKKGDGFKRLRDLYKVTASRKYTDSKRCDVTTWKISPLRIYDFAFSIILKYSSFV